MIKTYNPAVLMIIVFILHLKELDKDSIMHLDCDLLIHLLCHFCLVKVRSKRDLCGH